MITAMQRLSACLMAALLVPVVAGAAAAQSLADRIGHSTPEQYRRTENVHAGAGPMTLGTLLGGNALSTNLSFVHRGVILPGGGIGHHFHNSSEEMFFILNEGEAEFTVNGRTSRIKTPAAVPVTLGSSHALYNHTDQPLQWLNVAVSAPGLRGGAFDLGDPRVGVPLDPIPVFMWASLDHSGLRPQNGMHGGTGQVLYRRRFDPTVFRTPWAYVDQLVIQPGSSVGMHRHTHVSEVFYIISGEGRIRVGSESAAIRTGDAIPIEINEVHGIENTGSEPLDVIIIGIADDMSKNLETIDVE